MEAEPNTSIGDGYKPDGMADNLIPEAFMSKEHTYGFGFMQMPDDQCNCDGNPTKLDLKKTGDLILISKAWYREADLLAVAKAFYGFDFITEPDIISMAVETMMITEHKPDSKLVFMAKNKTKPLTKQTKNIFYAVISPVMQEEHPEQMPDLLTRDTIDHPEEIHADNP